ncbi:Gfo/Idh/MocA family oxidoreductase [Opitutales bacterium ASA1]|uniref:Gfo/Idh/MocA family protein n=1 Tax=Congregicoccus parvus TaxID=3081749 RepID=UPI002B2E144B|nr:Gfo/Idh/MocA family oxidoreductase [Opitutales bacterium ASA1]
MNRRRFLTHTAGALAGGSLLSASLRGQTTAAPAPAPSRADGATYAPVGKPKPVVKAGEFVIAAAHLDHGHIYGQCNGLTEAGAELKWVFEPDAKKLEAFQKRFPQVRVARALDEILDDPAVHLVTAAAVTSERGPLGCRVMEAGKDYFTDKAPFTTIPQLEQARIVAARTGRKYMVYYSERLHVESAMFATDLVQQGAIGRVLQVIGLGPHRLNAPNRPAWFFEREKYGGILCDIGSHQFEQFLTFSGATDATIASSAIANFAHPQYPELEDFGEASLVGDNGASNYVRVDWFTPAGQSVWGDGRTMILGTKGTIELRKYIDVAREKSGNHVYLVDEKGEHHLHVDGQVGFRFFGELILDCLNRTEKAMTQTHAFKAAELSLRAQAAARRLTA